MDILNEISLFLQTSVQMGTHILFAIVGGIICEKVGNMNLGIEGMMLMGAAVGFQVACATANPFLAVLSAGLAGLVGALIYAFITVTLRGNQVVTGLVLTIFGTGVAGFIGKSVSGNTVPAEVVDAFKPYDIPVLCDIPIIGKALFSQSGYVQAAIVVAILAYLYIKKTKFGLNIARGGRESRLRLTPPESTSRSTSTSTCWQAASCAESAARTSRRCSSPPGRTTLLRARAG